MILLMLLFGGCIKDCKKQKNKEDREECIKNCLKALNTKKTIEEIEKMDLDELEKQLSILKKIQEQEQKRKQQEQEVDNSNDYEIGGREI